MKPPMTHAGTDHRLDKLRSRGRIEQLGQSCGVRIGSVPLELEVHPASEGRLPARAQGVLELSEKPRIEGPRALQAVQELAHELDAPGWLPQRQPRS
ncbi:MAG: hypothetical protein K8H88_24465 [Sandaracinaceae bacterium]|nr:hypothetical protein [Sandaracinaceae bacterium]